MITRRTLWMAAIQAVALVGTLTLALDMYAHNRVEAFGGVNYWGYKGPVVNLKRPKEIRIVIVGGTRAFGWGVPSSALVSEVRRVIMLTTDQRGKELQPIIVVNLGRLGALADSYQWTIEHFSYLRPDYICLYDDLGVRGAEPSDGRSGVFALTGYAPALPLVLREKGMVWRVGDVAEAYAAGPHHRGPSAAVRRAAGTAIELFAGALGAADRLLARVLPSSSARGGRSDHGVTMRYDDAMIAAIDAAHRHARGVVVALSPAETAEQSANLRDLRMRLDRDMASAPWLKVVDLDGVAELRDASLRLEGWNYGSSGTALVANRIAPALVSLIEAAR